MAVVLPIYAECSAFAAYMLFQFSHGKGNTRTDIIYNLCAYILLVLLLQWLRLTLCALIRHIRGQHLYTPGMEASLCHRLSSSQLYMRNTAQKQRTKRRPRRPYVCMIVARIPVVMSFWCSALRCTPFVHIVITLYASVRVPCAM